MNINDVGEDTENIIVKLLQAANGSVEKAERGIIYIDEIDKLARRGDSASITRDVGGEGVQQALLKIIEGSVCNIPPQGGRKHPNGETISVDTTNILFIVGGAFSGLEKIIEHRFNTSSIGFGSVLIDRDDEEYDPSIYLDKVTNEDLIEFGLIPELIGRIHVKKALSKLSKEQLVDVLTVPKNAIIKQYEKIFSLEGITLEFTQDALIAIAEQASKDKSGARALRSIVEEKLLDVQYNLPELREKGLTEVIVNASFINNESDEPILMFENKEDTAN